MKRLPLILLSALLGVVLCGSPRSHAIGRSGNGKLTDRDDRFEAQAPESYLIQQNLGQGGLRLLSPMAPGFGVMQAYLEFRRLATEFPEFAAKSRDDWRAEFLSTGWQSMPAIDSCIEVLRFENSSTTGAVVAWGSERGVVVLAPRSPQNMNAIDEVLATLTIEAGACAWK
jgi:hypothetical protein